jgi:hypothetical protein
VDHLHHLVMVLAEAVDRQPLEFKEHQQMVVMAEQEHQIQLVVLLCFMQVAVEQVDQQQLQLLALEDHLLAEMAEPIKTMDRMELKIVVAVEEHQAQVEKAHKQMCKQVMVVLAL